MIKKLMIGVCAVSLLAVAGIALTPDSPEQIADSAKAALPASTPADSKATPQTAAIPSAAKTPAPDHDHDASQLPEYVEATPKETDVDLWQPDEQSPDTLFDGNPAKRVQTNPALIEQFHVGQKLRLRIPQRDATLETELDSTHNQSANVHVFHGKVVGGDPQDNVIVTRGKIETHVVISTHEGTYTAVIDNATGNTAIVDQADINAGQVPFDDGIPVPPVEQSPPPS